jgi:hypothetical protein
MYATLPFFTLCKFTPFIPYDTHDTTYDTHDTHNTDEDYRLAMQLQAQIAKEHAAKKEEEENGLYECPICYDDKPLPQMYFVRSLHAHHAPPPPPPPTASRS